MIVLCETERRILNFCHECPHINHIYHPLNSRYITAISFCAWMCVYTRASEQKRTTIEQVPKQEDPEE